MSFCSWRKCQCADGQRTIEQSVLTFHPIEAISCLLEASISLNCQPAPLNSHLLWTVKSISCAHLSLLLLLTTQGKLPLQPKD